MHLLARFVRVRERLLLGACAFLCAAAQPGYASYNAYDGDWHFTITPYIWVPSVDGQLTFPAPNVPGSGVHVQTNASDVWSKINFAFMGTADVRKGDLSFFTDFIYSDLSGGKAGVTSVTGPLGEVEIPVNVRTEASIKTLVWTNGIGYSLYHSAVSASDAFVGFRYLVTDNSVNWNFTTPLQLLPQQGKLSKNEDLWDAIIGVRGRFGFSGSHWFIPFYADIGTGESNLTGQALAGIGYRFSWGDLDLVYRYLYYQPGGSSHVVDNLSLQGPALGAKFSL